MDGEENEVTTLEVINKTWKRSQQEVSTIGFGRVFALWIKL